MKWRYSKLDWGYALGELLIVTAGVLIALYLDALNTGRLSKQEEIQYMERLLLDLEADEQTLITGERVLEYKIPALARLLADSHSDQRAYSTNLELLEDIKTGDNYGWSPPDSRRTTYEELISSGNLNLISDVSIRDEIITYYRSDIARAKRIGVRHTGYPAFSYRVAPSSLDMPLSSIDSIAAEIDQQELREQARAEENFAYYVRDQHEDWREQRDFLEGKLASYLIEL